MVPVTHFLPATGALTALKYITWNPVEAGYVEHPEDWVWSSHRTTAGLAEPLSVSESDDYLNHIVVGSEGFQDAIRKQIGVTMHDLIIPRSYRSLARPASVRRCDDTPAGKNRSGP